MTESIYENADKTVRFLGGQFQSYPGSLPVPVINVFQCVNGEWVHMNTVDVKNLDYAKTLYP